MQPHTPSLRPPHADRELVTALLRGPSTFAAAFRERSTIANGSCPKSAGGRKPGRGLAGLRLAPVVLVWACLFGLATFESRAQISVLIKEVISREVAVQVDGRSDPDPKELLSRESVLFVVGGSIEPARQLVSREVGLVTADADDPPPVVDLGVTVSPTGETVTLNWSSYNALAIRDVVRFDIYRSDDGPFSTVAGLVPFLDVPAGESSVTLTGLAPWRDHYFAVVAVDALGNFREEVTYSAAYVLSPELVSREVALNVESGFVDGGRQLVSREVGLVTVSTAPPPPITGLSVVPSADGSSVTLAWTGYDQWAVKDVARFDIYLSDTRAFTNLAGLSPYRSVPMDSNSVTLENLAAFTDHYFAVVPVDLFERFETNVTYAAAYVLSPGVVSREVALRVESGSEQGFGQVISREVGLLMSDATPPAPVTGLESGFRVETSTSAFGAVVLDWTHYDEPAQKDVVRYRIYLGVAPYEDVTGMAPYSFVPAGTQRHTLEGLEGLGIYHCAVVAEDGATNINPVVRSFSAQASASGVGEVRDLQVASGANHLDFGWAAPADAGAFLAGYRVYLGVNAPVDLASDATQWHVEGLSPAQGYPFRITTRDIFGGESPGRSILAATHLPNPGGVRLTATGADAVLVWDAVEPASLVDHYAVYRSDTPFTSVAGLDPIATTRGTTQVVGTTASVAGRHFAVATVNIADGTAPEVVSVSGTKEHQTVDFPVVAVGPLSIPLSATASSGLPVRFLASPTDVAAIDGSNLVVLQGGSVTVTARQDGNDAYWPAETSWTLRLPPVIRSFTADGSELAGGRTITAMSTELRVVSDDQEGLARALFHRRRVGDTDWTPWATDESASGGWSARVSLVGIPAGEYDLRVTVSTPSGASSERVRRVRLEPILLPDLSLAAMTVPGTAVAGQPIEVGWTTTNLGPGEVTGAWSTRLSLSRESSGANALDRGTVSTNRVLAIGASLDQAHTLIVPADWFGPVYLVVEVDPGAEVAEADETNNRFVASTPIQVFAADLMAVRWTAPSSAHLGAELEVSWAVTNRGGAATLTSWRDRIWLTPTEGSRVGGIELGVVPGPVEGLAPDKGYVRTPRLRIPLISSLPAGSYHLLLESDADGELPEVSEANNRLSRPITLALPPVPDLAVGSVGAPSEAIPGQPMILTWTVTNQTTTPVAGVWRESLSLSNALQGRRELALISYTNDLPGLGAVARTHSFTLPAETSGGDAVFEVTVDARGDVVEADESNNTRAAALTRIPLKLALQLTGSQVREDATVPLRATVTRNGDLTEPLTVTVTIGDSSELHALLPVLASEGTLTRYTLQMPARQGTAAFDLEPVKDGIVDADRPVTLEISAAGYEPAGDDVTVLNVDLPSLSLAPTSLRLNEGTTMAVNVVRDVITDDPVTVTLASSHPGQLSPPTAVTIPGGQASVSFAVLAVDDPHAEADGVYTLSATAPGFRDGSVAITVDDNDVPALVVTLSARTVSEGAGPSATSMTVTRTPVGPGSLSFEPVASDPAAVDLPLRITIQAGQASRSIPIGVVDDDLVNGTRTVSIGAYALAAGTGTRLDAATPDTLEILDDDGPTLKLTAARKLVPEGVTAATEVTVTRNTPPSGELLVTLVSSDTSEATIPASVTIPDGAVSATFSLDGQDDAIQDGNQSVVLTASAAGYVSGVETLVVTDADLPDLVATIASSISAAVPGERIPVRYRVTNQGLGSSTSSVLTRIYLSSDASAGNDLLVAQSRTTQRLEVGQSIEFDETLEIPMSVGNYWLVVETDAEQAIAEVLENNNTHVVAEPIVVTADYGAWVRTDTEIDLAGALVTLYGRTTNAAGLSVGPKAATIHVRLGGTERRIGATSDDTGAFTATFEPLPGEAGRYEIFATHPAVPSASVQDTFALLGFRPDPSIQSLTVIERTRHDSLVRLVNLSDVPLHDVTVEVLEKPASLEVTTDLAVVLADTGARSPTSGGRGDLRLASSRDRSRRVSPSSIHRGTGQAAGLYALDRAPQGDGPTLPASGALTLTVGIRAPVAESYGTVRLRVTTAEGLAQDIYFGVSVEPLRPRLVSNPPSLEAAMQVGGQAVVEFELINRGGHETGPIELSLPGVPWMSLATTNPMAGLAPGATNKVTLILTPEPGLDLTRHSGSLAANSADASLSVPFAFRAVSEAVGDVEVEVVDEFTYYAEGGPRVEGAAVTIRDALTQRGVASGFSDATGHFRATGLAEGYYDIEVTADQHTPYRATHRLYAGKANPIQAFLSRQTVTYTWTVEPVELEDRYKVTIESVFETVVPIPVVVVEPSVIDLAEVTGDESTVNLKVTNHGLIAANAARIQFGSHPDWEVRPLVDDLGAIPARTSYTIPVTVRRLTRSEGDTAAATESGRGLAGPGSGGPCSFAGSVVWALLCGGRTNHYSSGIGVINAADDCGGGGGGGGGFVPIGGGGSGNGSPASPYAVSVAFSPPTVCDCSLFPEFCLDLSVGVDLQSLLDQLVSKVLKRLPGLKAEDVDFSLKLQGTFCTCCIDNQIAWKGEGKATAQIAITLAGGISPPSIDLEFDSDTWASASVSFNGLLGVRGRLEGEATATLVRPCGGEPKICYSGRVGVGVFAGADIEGSASATFLADQLRYSGTVKGKAGLEGSLSASLQGCVGEDPKFAFCGSLYSRLNLSGTLEYPGTEPKVFSANADVPLWDTGCENQSGSGPALADEGNPPVYEPIEGTVLRSDRDILAALGAMSEGEGVCARVKLRLEQEAVIARDAFRATLQLDNDAATRLENVGVEVDIRDESGLPVNDLFGVRFEGSTTLSAVDGTGILPVGSSGIARWTLIPTVDAAPTIATRYLVGGTLRYRLEGEDVTVAMVPVPITVLPSPRLTLQYFHQRDVRADDPFTDAVEPSIPYSLGVLVNNHGYGRARNFRITSAQPTIVENEKGLLIDFGIIATEVFNATGASSLTPSLTATFGDIDAGQSAAGRWLLTSSLQGLFIDYHATFEHIDGMGNPRLSLIDQVSIHETIQVVQAGGVWEDHRPDFLVNEIPDLRDLPDTLYQSTGSTNRVEIVERADIEGTVGSGHLAVSLVSPMPTGWVYLRVPDPGQGRHRLIRVTRSDGVEIGVGTNAWTTDRTFIGMGRRPITEDILHLLDYDSTGRYTLVYSEAPAEIDDDVAPTSAVEPLPASVPPWFQVRWSGRDQGKLGQAAAGLATYDLFVSEDGAAFVPWLLRTRLVSATYLGKAGSRYAFYSVAVDAAGNREEQPSSPDTETIAAVENSAPVLDLPATLQVDEGSTLDFVARATDPDGLSQVLTFALEPGHPAGALIDGSSGQVRWATGEADGGSTRTLTLIVRDNGVPSLSATGAVSVVVREVNTPPIAVGDAVTRPPGRRVRISEAQLLANDFDVDGQSLRLVSVSPLSARGATVSRREGWITYFPVAGNDEADTFTYTVTDGEYQATGVVEVKVGGPTDQGTLNILGTTVGADGTVRLELVGIPGRNYAIQMTTSLLNAVWTTVGTATADATGHFTFVHENPPAGAAFYRAQQPAAAELR